MKHNILYSIGALLTGLLLMTACSPEDFNGVNEAGLPDAENAKVTLDVDQTIDQVTFNMTGDSIYPVWMIPQSNKVTYSTLNGLQKIFSTAGDYTIQYRVGNRNGMSQGTGNATFHIDNAIVDFNEYTAMMAGKVWRIDNTVAGHLACGPSGTDGTSYYSAQPNEKAGTGLYDNRLTFTADGKYSFDPGESGTTLVNTGCTLFNNPGNGQDYTATVDSQTVNYTFDVKGNDVYLVFPANTLFPYIPTDDAYNKELRLRLESITPSQMVLIYDNGNIAWHYVLTAANEGFQGYNADSDCNLFKNCNFTHTFYYAPGWTQIADPVVDETKGVNKYVIHLPTATTDTWQAQVFWHTDMTTNTANNYDFSCKLSSNKDHNNVTVKLADEDDDNSYYFIENIKLKAGQDYVFYKDNMPGIDMNKVKLVIDFGGNQSDTQVTVSDIDLQEHACDGVLAPSGDQDNTGYDYDNSTNIWKTNVDDKGADGYTTSFYYAPGWVQIADPEMTVSNGKYTINLPTATTDQWQAQVKLLTNIPGDADASYDFSCKMTPTKDINQVTVKITDHDNDGNYLFVNRYDLKAGQESVIKIPASKLTVGAAQNLDLVLDFGGNPADEKIDVYDIVLQKTVQ